MKRKNCESCGADYEISETKCTFCGAANVDYKPYKVAFTDEKRNPKDLRCPYCNYIGMVRKFDSFNAIQFNPPPPPAKKKAPVLWASYVAAGLGGLSLLTAAINGFKGEGIPMVFWAVVFLAYAANNAFRFNSFDFEKAEREYQEKVVEHKKIIDVQIQVVDKMHHLFICDRDQQIFFPNATDSTQLRDLRAYLYKHLEDDVS